MTTSQYVKFFIGAVCVTLLGLTVKVARFPNSAVIAATEPTASGSTSEVTEMTMVTTAELFHAGFVKDRSLYNHAGMTLESLRKLVRTSHNTVTELPNTDSVFPQATFQFPGGACNVTYTDLYLNPERRLDDGANRVRVYLWFYEPEQKK